MKERDPTAYALHFVQNPKPRFQILKSELF